MALKDMTTDWQWRSRYGARGTLAGEHPLPETSKNTTLPNRADAIF